MVFARASGSTTESIMGFRHFRDLIDDKYRMMICRLHHKSCYQK